MTKTIQELTVVELKAAWLDLLMEGEQVAQKIQMIKAELEKRAKEAKE